MRKWLLIPIFYLLPVVSFASPPPADEVFQVSTKLIDPNTFTVTWDVKPGYFLYSDRIKFSMPDDSLAELGDPRKPTPVNKVDKQGNVYTVYRDKLSITIPVLNERAGETLVDLGYQGCSDDGFCYPPETRQILLSVGENLALNSVSFYEASNTPTQGESPPIQNNVESVFSNQHWVAILLSFFSFGLLLAFTPCVLPMVPVLSGIIIGHGENITTRKAFFLSLSYVLSMAATYAAVGAIVASLGSNLQILMQSPWAIGLFSALFVLLAISMFGYYELKLPVSWQARLAKLNRSQESGHYISAAIMGCLSTLILSPCVTAPLIGALSYIAHTGNVLMGSLSLFFLGLGMGAPLLLIGASAGRLLPKAGKWMNAVKAFFGIMLLVVAVYLLERILPPSLVMGLWAALLVYSGIFIGALVPARSHPGKFRQASGIILLVYGLLILVGTSTGSTNPLLPLAKFSSHEEAQSHADKNTVTRLSELKEAISLAQGKPVMIDYYADWCSSCKVMNITTFKDPDVVAALKQLVVITVDVTANNAESKALLKDFNVVAPPTFIFLNGQGEELSQLRMVGEISGKEFIRQLQLVKEEA